MSVMPSAKNQPDDIKIRKFRDTLVTGGAALISFGFWTIIRSVLEISQEVGDLLKGMSFKGLTEAQIEKIGNMVFENPQIRRIAILAIGILVVDLVIRIYIGLSARAIGLQKKNKKGKEKNGVVWLILCFILAILGAYSLITTLMTAELTIMGFSFVYFVVQLIVEVTSLFITLELVITDIRLRSLIKKQGVTEEVRDAA